LAVGAGLPSEREFASRLGVSRTTVVAAYGLLREQGWLESRHGSGSWLRLPGKAHKPTPQGLREHPANPAYSAFGSGGIYGWEADSLHRDGTALPDSSAIDLIDLTTACPEAPLAALSSAVLAAKDGIARYAGGDGYMPFGLPALRELIANRYTHQGVPTCSNEILITSGAQHAITLTISELTAPGDSIVVECPTYPIALDAIRACHRTPLPVGFTDESSARSLRWSWDGALISDNFRQSRTRMAYFVPDFHNPTGSLMDATTREQVVTAARRTGTILVVDETFRDLPFPDCDLLPPPMAAFDPSRVVSVGSMSKTFWGGLRVGWIRAAGSIIQRLTAARATADMAGSVLDQLVSLELLSCADETVRQRRSQLATGSKVVIAALDSELPTWQATRPAGGASLWVRAPRPIATEIAMISPSLGVRIAPGPRFSPDGTMNSFIRLPFTRSAEEIREGVARLAAAVRRFD